MPRPKGSKNKVKAAAPAAAYEEAVAAKNAEKEQLMADIAVLEADIEESRKQIKDKKAQAKAIDKELASMEAKKEAEEKAAAEKAAEEQVQSILKEMLAGGMSAADIAAKLQQ